MSDAILPRRGPTTKAMARRLQEDWARDAGECPRVLMSLRGRFWAHGLSMSPLKLWKEKQERKEKGKKKEWKK